MFVIGVQEFDRVMVERRCHVILNEGNRKCLPFLRGDYHQDSGFLDGVSFYF